MTRVFIRAPLVAGDTIELPDAAARHLVQVLRMREGQPLTLFNGEGGEYRASLSGVTRRAATARIEAHIDQDCESPLRLSLAQCVSKGERMEYAIQKAVELGVAEIVPLLSARSVIKLDEERWDKKLEHWRGVIVSACEQCGRNRVPMLAPVARLDHWLDSLPEPAQGELRLTLAPGGQRSLKSLPAAASAQLLVGPEGGLADAEIQRALRRAFTPIQLGPRILRTETAGVAALAAMQALWGDMA